jgi:hypothetical protein
LSSLQRLPRTATAIQGGGTGAPQRSPHVRLGHPSTSSLKLSLLVGVGLRNRRKMDTRSPAATGVADVHTDKLGVNVCNGKMEKTDTTERLARLRAAMKAAEVQAYVIPSEDAHQVYMTTTV